MLKNQIYLVIFYLDMSDRIYQGWLHNLREKSIRKIIFLKSLVISRQKSKAFVYWASSFTKEKIQVKNIENGNAKEYLSSSENFKTFLKEQSYHASTNSDINHLFHQNSKPKIPAMKRSVSNSYYEKEDKSALFNRLYEDAAKKKYLLEKAQNDEKDKGMEECTFRPEITDYNSKKPPVFERLNYSDIKEKEEFYRKQKESKELEGCTFRPKTNSVTNLSMDGSFDKLYKDAEAQRQKLRAKELIEKDRELADCTFRPTVLNPSTTSSGSVYEKLYNSYQESQKNKRRLELERKTKEDEESKFIPKLLTPKKEGDSTPVYARLYAEVEKRKEKLKKKTEEKERSNSASRSIRKSDEPPRYEHLYSLHKEAQEKKAQLQEKYYKESGLCFKPDTTKSNTPKRSQAHSPKSSYQIIRKKSVESFSEPSIH